MPMSQDFSKNQQGDPPTADGIDDAVIVSPDTRRAQRIPQGQTRTRKWPVLHHGAVPKIPMDQWRLRIEGLVEQPLSFTWNEFQALSRVKVFADFHCVTRWSRLGNLWEGVSVRDVVRRAGVQQRAQYAIIHGFDDGWTTNVPLEEFLTEDALFADRHDGEPISTDHGGPLRLVVPSLYAWKSAKWVSAVEFTATDRPGFWERGGYHNHGDPWKEERYSW